ncbi:DUF2243 domain-containing protein [Marivirga sp. S37H4]|uniref:DUF2243 domain-containing protein n=1 Tax=Marivirga aurantiaca TaxID=2802615 RepID=A0A935CAK1_9BACT|nr:DUF2243 domain-containing protein [Marivirga aurantiaca]MBK6266589.1 DUF2243 domain-containing protein [Marivirga aurantiaca]
MKLGSLSHRKSGSLWAGVLTGTGIMAAVDEIIFHQLLSWHHFYDKSTLEIGLLSDGLLHSAELIAIVAGFFLIIDLNKNQALVKVRIWAGFFLGTGGFQLLDGTINHKVLRLHQIRYVDNILPYDIAWNATGIFLLIIGIVILIKAKKSGEIEIYKNKA